MKVNFFVLKIKVLFYLFLITTSCNFDNDNFEEEELIENIITVYDGDVVLNNQTDVNEF